MILKIERYVDYDGNIVSNDWWIIDGIKKIHHHFIEDRPFNKDFSTAEAEIFLLDYEMYLDKSGAGQDSRHVISLICRSLNGDEFRILFDTMAYILNDNGKTIEKLVANYRLPQN